jgi:hypothetical protein
MGIVYINGKDSGIRETNRAWAEQYWQIRAWRRPELKIRLEWV